MECYQSHVKNMAIYTSSKYINLFILSILALLTFFGIPLSMKAQ